MTRRRLIPLGILACLLAVTPAFGAAVCSLDPASTAFGVYDSLGSSDDDTLSTITVRCTGTIGDPVNYSIALNAGTNGTFAHRLMAASGSQLDYNLYLDANHTSIWGDGTNGTSTLSGSYTLGSSSDVKTFTVYARLAGGQSAATASAGYTDSVMITLTY